MIMIKELESKKIKSKPLKRKRCVKLGTFRQLKIALVLVTLENKNMSRLIVSECELHPLLLIFFFNFTVCSYSYSSILI